MDHGSVRNLEQIQETDAAGGTPRGVTILLVALGAGCVVFAALALGGKRGGTAASAKTDPLGELVTQQVKAGAGSAKPTDLSSRDVTFPGILSDEGAPTTALAAVKGNGARPAASGAALPDPGARAGAPPVGTENAPPPPT